MAVIYIHTWMCVRMRLNVNFRIIHNHKSIHTHSRLSLWSFSLAVYDICWVMYGLKYRSWWRVQTRTSIFHFDFFPLFAGSCFALHCFLFGSNDYSSSEGATTSSWTMPMDGDGEWERKWDKIFIVFIQNKSNTNAIVYRESGTLRRCDMNYKHKN